VCGIAGFIAPGALEETAEAVVRGMTQAIARRGPDDCGHWVDHAAGVALGFRRLSIIDLTAAGHQPMASHDGRFVIVFNGEIYNFADIRAELERSGNAPSWTGRSDTEVLLAAVVAWGLEAALRRARGMFALALWDRRDRTLTLARDRMGEKPLYYGWQGGGSARRLLFGSEIAALRKHPAFAPRIDAQAIGLLVRTLYIPEPYSAYLGVQKLMPGTFITIDPRSGRSETTTYWDSLAVAAKAGSDRFRGTPKDAVDELAVILGDAVERAMVSDVPLGAFLSGGLDSSTVVALMQERSSRPVQTFTIGFDEKSYDEAGYARAVAAHLGTDHTEMILAPAEAQAVILALPDIYSEPFADSSQIPTFIVSRLARRSVTVSLSGDGGDELFGGYNRHLYSHRYWGLFSRIPGFVRDGLPSVMTSLSPDTWDRMIGRVLGKFAVNPGDKIHRAANVIASRSFDELYDKLISINPRAQALVNQPIVADGFAGRDLSRIADLGPTERMMVLDAIGYLPGDILTKVDRAAMANSLETRVPMLDPEVMEFAWRLPIDMKIRGGATKWPLRELLHRHVPRSLVTRPKMGFGIPIGAWLRGPLRDWGEAMLDERSLSTNELFNPKEVRRLWDVHQSGWRNYQHQLWPILMVQAWLNGPFSGGARTS